MTKERWVEIIGNIKDNFEVKDEGSMHLDDEGGVDKYMRQSAITYVALEFTWPGVRNAETWGLRVEFASAAEAPIIAGMSGSTSGLLDSTWMMTWTSL